MANGYQGEWLNDFLNCSQVQTLEYKFWADWTGKVQVNYGQDFTQRGNAVKKTDEWDRSLKLILHHQTGIQTKHKETRQKRESRLKSVLRSNSFYPRHKTSCTITDVICRPGTSILIPLHFPDTQPAFFARFVCSDKLRTVQDKDFFVLHEVWKRWSSLTGVF